MKKMAMPTAMIAAAAAVTNFGSINFNIVTPLIALTPGERGGGCRVPIFQQ